MAERTPPPAPDGSQRRGFLTEFLAVVIGAGVGLVSLVSGLVVALDPLRSVDRTPRKYRQRGGGGKEGFIRIASLDAVPADGVPRRFPVISNVVDAWSFIPEQPIGAVYVRRTADSLIVLQATCPHAGCSVAPSTDGTALHCPCHNSSFGLDGTKMDRPGKQNPSPRDLDRLEYDEEKLAADPPELWIRFQEFYTGREHAEAKV